MAQLISLNIGRTCFNSSVLILAALLLFIAAGCSRSNEGTHIYNGSEVKISLPKDSYKMYEPIELQYEWINHKDIPDTIWGVFEISEYTQFFITDENGKVYTNQPSRLDIVHSRPAHYVQKGETVAETITLNHIGIAFKGTSRESYFSCFSYLPPGKYRVYSVIEGDAARIYTKPMKTNEVEFEVTELSERDEKVLALVRDKKYKEALHSYPGDYFDEYLMRFEMSEYFLELFKAGETNERYKDTSKLPAMCSAFFDKYPNSPYNLSDNFISGYLRVSSKDSAGSQVKMQELLAKYPGTNISKTVNSLKKKELFTGISSVYFMNEHKKNGRSKETIPQDPVNK